MVEISGFPSVKFLIFLVHTFDVRLHKIICYIATKVCGGSQYKVEMWKS